MRLGLGLGLSRGATTPPPVLSGTFPAAYLNTAYSNSLTITDGVAPYTVTLVSGTLPTGNALAVSGSTVPQTGTPTVGGDYTYQVKVTDANGRDSNTLTFTNHRVNVFSNPTFSMKRGKKTRVGYAASLCGYLGSDATFASDLTVSGTGSSDWQCQNRITATVRTLTITQTAPGLAPKGASATWNTAWVASPSNTYTLTLTHTATGQTCTVTVDTNFAAKMWNDRTYTNDNCITIGTIYEMRNPSSGTTYANLYINRNVNEGGWIMVQDGTFLGSEGPLDSIGWWMGSGTTFLNGTQALTRGTFDKGLATTGTAAGTHGDRTRGRVTEGWEGGNYTLVTPETPFGASLTNVHAAAPGLIFTQFNVVAPDTASGGIVCRSNDTIVDCCDVTRVNTGTAVANGVVRFVANPYPRYATVLNSRFDGANGNMNGVTMWLLEPHIAGNIFTNIQSDCMQANIDPAHANFPVGATADGYVGRNIGINTVYASGAHPDLLQIYIVTGTSGTLGGAVEIEYNFNAGYTMQGIFNGGGSSTTAKFSMNVHHNILINADQVNQMSWINQQDYTVDCNTILHDYRDAAFMSGNTPGFVDSGGSVNGTITDNISHRVVASPSFSGTLTGNDWTNVDPGDNYQFTAANDTLYGAAFTNVMPVGGLRGVTAGIVGYDAAFAAVIQYAIPKASSSLKRADNSGPGAVAQGSGSTFGTVTWNDGSTAWAA